MNASAMPAARKAMPRAAVVLPLPSPVKRRMRGLELIRWSSCEASSGSRRWQCQAHREETGPTPRTSGHWPCGYDADCRGEGRVADRGHLIGLAFVVRGLPSCTPRAPAMAASASPELGLACFRPSLLLIRNAPRRSLIKEYGGYSKRGR